MHIRIEMQAEGLKRPVTRNYNSMSEAMDEWDRSLEGALEGERWRLINLETGSIMSEYVKR
jgi:hypothetical protein